MQIESLHVKGYRSIADQEIHPARLQYFLGRNNAGKSNLINAIRLLIEGGTLKDGDFHKVGEDVVEEVSVTAKISGATKALDRLGTANKTKLEPFVHDDSVTLKCIATQSNPKAQRQILDPNDGEYKNPAGIDAALKKFFPTVVSIETFKDPVQEIGTKSTTALMRLVKSAVDAVAEKLGDLEKSLSAIDKKLNAQEEKDDRAEEIIAIESAINDQLSPFLGDDRIRIRFGLPDIGALTSRATLEIGTKTRGWHDGSFQGQGFQRMMVFALLTVLNERATEEQEPLLILFEEPESFLHPSMQRELATTLESLSVQHQILAVTHSPIFVHDVESLRRITRTTCGEATTFMSCDDHVFANLQENKLLHAFSLQNTSEFLFADHVLVVEGRSDEVIMGAIVSQLGTPHLKSQAFAIVEINGKDRVQDWVKAFNSLGLETQALIDLDFFWNGAGSPLAGNRTYQKLLERFKKELVILGVWDADKNTYVEKKKPEAFSWLVEHGGDEFQQIRQLLRDSHGIWMLSQGEIEDQFSPRFTKGRYPALA